MKAIISIALLSLKEGLKQRVLYGVVLAAILMMCTGVLASGFFLRDVSKVILDFCLATVTLGGLTIPLFLAIHMFARDLERRTVFTLLSRPISRGQYLLGKFSGLLLLTGLIMFFLTVGVYLSLECGEFLFGKRFFVTVSWSSIFVALFLSFLSVMILNALAVFWSTLTTSSFLATLLTIFSYVIGHFVDDVVRFLQANTTGVDISSSIKQTVEVAQYIFPNLAAFDVKSAAAHGMTIPTLDAIFLTIYACIYSCLLLMLATAVFKHRDLT